MSSGTAPPARGALAAYVQEMTPDLYGTFWMRRRIAEEVTDHLNEAVERLQSQGLSLGEAEARAVANFGPPSLVARTFARMKGIGVTTNFTRWSGIALILGVAAMAVAFVGEAISVAFEHSVFGPIAISGLSLVGVGLAGVYVRLRGQLGRTARLGARMLYVGVPGMLICSTMWFAPGALLFMLMAIVGFCLYLVAMTRSEILPRRAVALLWVGAAGSALIGIVGFTFKIEQAEAAGVAGQVFLAAGLVWIGLHLWREVAGPEPSESPAAIA